MARIIINADIRRAKIDRNVYGNFAEHLGRCVYEGLWVGKDSSIPNENGIRKDVVAALREMKLPLLRWPGGCFADTYHWKDGVGPQEGRKRIVNVHWGDTVEDNSFGTDEFLELCRQLECDPYICGNVGSGTVQEMQEWVEYLNSKGTPMAQWRKENGHGDPYGVVYFGVGNENWGCGGRMTPDYYADEYLRYSTYLHNYDAKLYKIACGPNVDNYDWTQVLMKRCTKQMDGLALHYYTHCRDGSNSATDFGELEWASTLRAALRMQELIERHRAIMDFYDPEKKVALVVDEWGSWYDVEPGTHPRFLYMQDTLRDALVAGVTLNLFHHHSDRVRMANIAQLANVLQSVILTDGEKMVKTPTYYVFQMYAVHQNAAAVQADLVDTPCYEFDGIRMPKVSQSASIDDNGTLHVSLCCLDPNQGEAVTVDLRGMDVKSVSGTIITTPNMQALNDFDAPEQVRLEPFDAFTQDGDTLTVQLPAKSVVTLAIC